MRLRHALFAPILCFFIATEMPASHAGAGDASCLAHGERLVLAPFPEARDALAWHVRRRCRKAAAAVRSIRDGSAAERQEPCRSLVLVPAYLDVCLHFRDVVLPEAFQPCWDWAREQQRRCVAGDQGWFDADAR